MPGPMKPNELGKWQASCIPEKVFEAVNKAIALNWDGNSATVNQKPLIAEILVMLEWSEDDRQAIYDLGYLNFEEAYREIGWVVIYDKPGYHDSYGANWTFKRN